MHAFTLTLYLNTVLYQLLLYWSSNSFCPSLNTHPISLTGHTLSHRTHSITPGTLYLTWHTLSHRSHSISCLSLKNTLNLSHRTHSRYTPTAHNFSIYQHLLYLSALALSPSMYSISFSACNLSLSHRTLSISPLPHTLSLSHYNPPMPVMMSSISRKCTV